MKLRIKQQPAPLKKVADIDQLDNLIVLLPAARAPRTWPSFPYANVIRERWRRRNGDANSTSPLVTELPNRTGTRLSFALVTPQINSFDLLTLARKLVAPHIQHNADNLTVQLVNCDAALGARLATAVTAACAAATADMPRYKSARKKTKHLKSIKFCGLAEAVDFDRTLAEAAGNTLARQLTTLPPNELTPRQYHTRVRELAEEQGWDMQFLDINALKRKKAGAFLAVAQGSEEQDAGIVHLRYRPRRHSDAAPLALVGKGICYDTGGTNLKPARGMFGMHEDMEGSAVALGTFLALTRLKVDFPVDCWLALAQNHIGPRAYKQNDVVTACNGTTIEVVHTDAEGRMVLADTLALCAREKPAMVIDYATLTGTCVYALGSAYSGAFTNRRDWVEKIIAAGRDSGERVWPFPTDEDYDRGLESDIADVKQCAVENEADHILAARFLGRFVGDTIPWIHVDLSAGNNKGGLAHIPTDVTGFGVRFTLQLLLEAGLMARR